MSGSSSNDDIALDDLKMLNGELCPPAESSCAFKCSQNDQCVPEKSLCNFINDCPDGEDELKCGYKNITFENDDYGNWTIDYDGLYTWQLGSDGDGYYTGPEIGLEIFASIYKVFLIF